jgi:hypothetical protein
MTPRNSSKSVSAGSVEKHDVDAARCDEPIELADDAQASVRVRQGFEVDGQVHVALHALGAGGTRSEEDTEPATRPIGPLPQDFTDHCLHHHSPSGRDIAQPGEYRTDPPHA